MKNILASTLILAGLGVTTALAADSRPGDIAGLAYPNTRVEVAMKSKVRLSGRVKAVNQNGLVLVTQGGFRDVEQLIPHGEIESVSAIGYRGVARRGAMHVGRVVRFGVGLPFYLLGVVLE